MARNTRAAKLGSHSALLYTVKPVQQPLGMHHGAKEHGRVGSTEPSAVPVPCSNGVGLGALSVSYSFIVMD